METDNKREIKFRAWLPKYGCEEEDPKEYCMFYDLCFEEHEPVNDSLNRVENLMQYTGMKDRKGKDIYEGDKMSFHCLFFGVGEEKLSQGYVVYSGTGFKIRTAHSSDRELNLITKDEVIGNIYEGKIK